jgi:hypothetical protein
MKVTNIKWVTDGEDIELPLEVEVDDNMSEDEISDYLSDTYCFLHEGFSLPTDNK